MEAKIEIVGLEGVNKTKLKKLDVLLGDLEPVNELIELGVVYAIPKRPLFFDFLFGKKTEGEQPDIIVLSPGVPIKVIKIDPKEESVTLALNLNLNSEKVVYHLLSKFDSFDYYVMFSR
jgi:hypothetical protein